MNICHHFGKSMLCLIGTILCIPDEVYYRLFSVKKGILVNTTGANGLSAVLNASKNTSGSTPSGSTAVIPKTGTVLGERWEIWSESVKQILERPIFGHGAGTQTALEMYKAIGIDAPHAHNIILQILLEGGVIALIIIGGIGFVALRTSIQTMRCRDSGSFWMGFAMLGFLTCFMAHGMIDYPLAVPRLICFFIMVLGIIDSSIYTHPRKNSNLNSTLFKKKRFSNV